MNVQVINDTLEEFEMEITSIEEQGLDIFLTAKNIWGENWYEYLVWHENMILERVMNPDVIE